MQQSWVLILDLVEALGYSGGIWLFWKDSLTINIIKTHPQFILDDVVERVNKHWLLSVVYGSPNHTLRSNLRQDLNRIIFNLTNPGW